MRIKNFVKKYCCNVKYDGKKDIPVAFVINPVHDQNKGYHANNKINRI
jgi:hypothetical protein